MPNFKTSKFRSFSNLSAGAQGLHSALPKTIAYIVCAAAVAVPGLWWLTPSSDEAPRLDLEGPPTKQLVFDTGPSKNAVTRILSQNSYSFMVKTVSGVNRYDGTQLASNSVCEDRFTHGKLPSPWNDNNQWMAWGVFDGHAGWQTAALLQKQLLPFVRYSLGNIEPTPGGAVRSDKMIQTAIKKGFVDLDEAIMELALTAAQSEEPLQDKVKKSESAWAGSCALLAMYDPAASTLQVACTGDSRAVLGREDSDGKWRAIPLSVDQTANNPEEVARISKEHPGEEGIVKDGRVLGLVVSRAFGDSRWKWAVELQKDLKRRLYGPRPLTPKYDIRTPPYITAEPIVTTTKIDPNKPSFLILATDGLWDTLTNQQAVDLVKGWLESRASRDSSRTPEPTHEPFDFGHFRKGVSWKFVAERATFQDDNVAVHLVRNSLGGNHHELLAGRLAFSSPFSRSLRDDITVQVVFFNVPGLESSTQKPTLLDRMRPKLGLR
ncbi:uncharacterized protein L3040_004312 [Drepanopeziza brunnea f. sp. 'multigermtubi']|uniref:uncharacterized protein n=1 Tax=Drepanopeziza brunnea f. sp. 'multigermtubi' TaxID=698441 RepID=UPI00238F7C47|nr:hypothetical protein L3040_004312 [Drepanopeziza brunnea f. sp. 'multigermtubi']